MRIVNGTNTFKYNLGLDLTKLYKFMIEFIIFLFKETRPKCLAYLLYCRNDLMLLLLVLFLISQEAFSLAGLYE